MLLSGLFYPRIGMPLIPQLIGDIAPLTYFIRIARGIITKGIGVEFFWPDILALTGFVFICLILSSVLFKRRLG